MRGWQPFLLPGEKAFLYENRGCGKRSAQAVKKGRTLTFHWRGGYLTREVLDELLDIIQENARAKMQHALISLNWPQAVLSVRFAPEEVQETVMLDEANEGEQN